MDKILHDLKDCCAVYIDDIVVTAKGTHEMFTNLGRVLDALDRAGMTLNTAKCQFMKKKLRSSDTSFHQKV